MEEIISKLKNWNLGKKEPPSVLEFHFSDGCNQSCVFCDFNDYKISADNKLLSDEDYYRLTKEAIKMKVDEIRLCGGGEPFFNKKRALKIMTLVKDAKIKCRIITNGTMLNEKDIKKIISSGVEDIQISLMGHNSEIHDALVGLSGAFNKSIQNISLFEYWKKKLGSTKPSISIYFILNKLNYKHLAELGRFFSTLGISRFGVYDLDMRSEGCNNISLTQKEKNSIIKEISSLKKVFFNKNIDFYYQETLFHKSKLTKNKIIDLLKLTKSNFDLLNVPCYEPWYYLGINGDGTLQLCPNIGHLNFNINKMSLKDIWFGKEMSKVRQLILNKDIKGKCLFCCNLEVTVPIRNSLIKKINKK